MNTPSPRWIKSSSSGSTNNCVEVAALTGEFRGVRDSKSADGPVLAFGMATWSKFLASAVHGNFSR